MPYLSIVIASVCAAFFWTGAQIEGAPRWLWGGLSLLISAAIIYWLNWGFIGIIPGQIALFIAIAIFRARRNPRL